MQAMPARNLVKGPNGKTGGAFEPAYLRYAGGRRKVEKQQVRDHKF